MDELSEGRWGERSLQGEGEPAAAVNQRPGWKTRGKCNRRGEFTPTEFATILAYAAETSLQLPA